VLSSMYIIFACTVFQVSSDLQFKSEFSEEIQINKLNVLAIENIVIIVPKWYM
jgi:sporulation protein YlmC with PRC-barrel domain